MKFRALGYTAVAALTLGLAACEGSGMKESIDQQAAAQKADEAEANKGKGAMTAAQIDAAAKESLAELYKAEPGSEAMVKKAKGVLVFPKLLKGGLIVAAQTGDGVLMVKGKPTGYYNLTSASVGLTAGGQVSSEAILFMTEDALKKFEGSAGWTAGADGQVAVLGAGAAKGVSTDSINEPIVAYIFGVGGLMADASLNGQKITKIDRK